jgi:spermidine synthase
MPTHSVETSEEAGVRYLHFGSEWVQGAMRIARPFALELEYTREMMGCLLLRPDEAWPSTVLQVGLGAASLTKFIHRHRPEALQTILEINPAVVAMARQRFKLPQADARINIVVADALLWMQAASRERFDCILVDGFDEHARFGALGSAAFYADCRNRLTARGMLVQNLFGRSRGFARQIDALHDVFNGRVLALEPIEGGNAIAFAWTGEAPMLDRAALQERAHELRESMGIDFRGTLMRIARECSLRPSLSSPSPSRRQSRRRSMRA